MERMIYPDGTEGLKPWTLEEEEQCDRDEDEFKAICQLLNVPYSRKNLNEAGAQVLKKLDKLLKEMDSLKRQIANIQKLEAEGYGQNK